MASAEIRTELVGKTRRLIEFLRDMATARRETVYDIDGHDAVLWLADRPGQADLFAAAGSGDPILAMDPVTAEPSPRLPEELHGLVDRVAATDSSGQPPALAPGVDHAGEARPVSPRVERSYRAWCDSWQLWAEADRRITVQRHWYDRLFSIHQQLEQRADEVELVVASGLLAWDPPEAPTVRNHLLSVRAHVDIDPDTARLSVILGDDAARIIDRDLLGGVSEFDAGRAEPIRERLRSERLSPLADVTKEVLEQWRTLALTRSRPYEHDNWSPPRKADEVAELRLAPALVLRRRDSASLMSYYERMLEALEGPDAEAPLGLAQLVTTLEPEERMDWMAAEATQSVRLGDDPLFPLPANQEQRHIIERLRSDNGVVVQGPPGTGKSHSIANMISALLAEGQRVLVTSQKSQALKVLKDKLPAEVAELCVSMTDLTRGGSQELNRSVNALSERFGQYDPAVEERRVVQLSAQRDNARHKVAVITEQIRALRESETYEHSEVSEGYSGTLAGIGRKLLAQEAIAGWVPVPLPDGTGEIPLSSDDLAELRHLLSTATASRLARTGQDLPAAEALPASSDVRRLFAEEAAAAQHADTVANDLSRQLAGADATTLTDLVDQLRYGEQELWNLTLPEDPQAWPRNWVTEALSDGFARRNELVWRQLDQHVRSTDELERMFAGIMTRQVVLPKFEPTGPDSAPEQLEAAKRLLQHLRDGGELRRRRPKPIQRDAQLILDQARVDGLAPSSPELLEIVVTTLETERLLHILTNAWAAVGCRLEVTGPLPQRISQVVAAQRAWKSVSSVLLRRDHVARKLAATGAAVALDTASDWKHLVAALDAVRARIEADQASAEIARNTETIRLKVRGPGAPPELHHAVTALDARDAAGYEAALAGLTDAHHQQAAQRRCDDLEAQLTAAHPGLAQILIESAADDIWDERLATWPQAWAWAKARTFFDQQRDPDREQQLEASLVDAVARAEQTTAELAAAKAWQQTLARMTGAQTAALNSYRSHMQQFGAGTGKWAQRYADAAREALGVARDAVPAWIMALPEILETIPPDRNSFDVVIVDEASQASLDALFLLWLAPRVIVVGDDRQCTPSQIRAGALQPIFDKLDDYLRDLPEYLRLELTPKSSLFSLLTTRFGAVIRLREHFRCMPEIIGWSSRQFYADSPLVPLRQYGSDRLRPLRHTHVVGGFAEGSSGRLHNNLEAEALVEQLADCLEDPAYDGKSMGVVVLQGTAQIAAIQALLHSQIPTTAWEERHLRVGIPPDFQGDERDVVFLSMVASGTPRVLTANEFRRRFNVAASRARDQLWLFHSMTPDALRDGDLRHSLLTYVRNPPAPESTELVTGVTDDEPHPAFDSLFEQRVYRRITDAGFRVTPQVEVNGRRIDLVVTGAKARLAVECDGEAFHSTAEQRGNDLQREQELRRAGWRFWRVRESEFYFDPERALESLWEELERRGIEPGDHTEAPEASAGTTWSPTKLSSEELSDDAGDQDPRAVLEAQAVAQPAPGASDRGGRSVAAGSAEPATPPPTVARRPRRAGPGTGGPTSGEVRRWARQEGIRVGERGRLPPAVVQAWNESHPDRPFGS